jgi:hypothetical protein
MCYLSRTYHVLPTAPEKCIARPQCRWYCVSADFGVLRSCKEQPSRVDGFFAGLSS